MDAIDILKERSEAFERLAKNFAVLSPPAQVEGRFAYGKVLRVASGDVIDLTSMDCLALGYDPDVKRSLAGSVQEHDNSCTASAVVAIMEECRLAEKEAARWLFPNARNPEALLFFLGFDANTSFLYALGRGIAGGVLRPYRRELAGFRCSDVLTEFFQNSCFHYSGQLGISQAVLERHARCLRHVYKDLAHLELLLKKKQREAEQTLKIIATDAMLSTTGEVYDMEALLQIADRYGCLLYVDEAHAGFSMGPQGRGITAAAPSFQVLQERVILMLTMGKAMGLFGALVAFANGNLKRMFTWTSPHRVFSATPSPFICDQITKRVILLKEEEGDRRRKHLSQLVGYARDSFANAGFELMGDHHLCALWIKPAVASQVRSFIASQGFLTAAFESPAVPLGKALLRFCLRADLTREEIDRFVHVCCRAQSRFDFTAEV
jgi:glycine C-acetyltransferase